MPASHVFERLIQGGGGNSLYPNFVAVVEKLGGICEFPQLRLADASCAGRNPTFLSGRDAGCGSSDDLRREPRRLRLAMVYLLRSGEWREGSVLDENWLVFYSVHRSGHLRLSRNPTAGRDLRPQATYPHEE